MRILSVTPYYHPEGGGLERYAHAILARLQAQGHTVQALAFTRGVAGMTETDGVRVQRIRAPMHLGNAPIDPGFPRRLDTVVRRFRPDRVWAHSPVPFPAEMASRVARRNRIPFALTYHAGRLRGSTPALSVPAALDRWTLQRRMIQDASTLMAVSPFVRDNALRRRRDGVHIVPPGVDTGLFHPDPDAPRSKEILFVGPVSSRYRWKGLDPLLKAFRALHGAHPDAGLHIVGRGDRTDEVARLAARHDLPVRITPHLDDAGLCAAYQGAAAVVLPSTTDAEAFGMVLAEANACGRPVVGSRIGGIPDFVRHGDNGLLAEPGDPADLADRLHRLLEDPVAADAMGERGRRRVATEHDWDRLAHQCSVILADDAAP